MASLMQGNQRMEDLKSTVWFRTMRSYFLSTEVIKMALEEDTHCCFSLIQHSLDLVLAQWPGARVLGIERVSRVKVGDIDLQICV